MTIDNLPIYFLLQRSFNRWPICLYSVKELALFFVRNHKWSRGSAYIVSRAT